MRILLFLPVGAMLVIATATGAPPTSRACLNHLRER